MTNVEEIGDSAFNGCKALTTVELPETLTRLAATHSRIVLTWWRSPFPIV